MSGRLRRVFCSAISEALEYRRMLSVVTSSKFDPGGGLSGASGPLAQGINLDFSSSVSPTAVKNALTLLDLAQNTLISRSNFSLTGSTSVRVEWPTYTTAGTPTGMLREGHYELLLEDGSTSPVSQSHVLDFGVYNADLDGDSDVDFDDLLKLNQNYGTFGKTYAQGNVNRDAQGTVNFDDLLLLAQRYGTGLVELPTEDNSLEAGSGSTSSITLSFSPPIDPGTGVASVLFTGFRVYRSTDGIDFTQVSLDNDPLLQRDGSSLYSWTDTGRAEGTKYWYRVRPFNTDAGNGAPLGSWNTTNKTSEVTVLSMPRNLNAIRTGANTVGLSWQDFSTTETRYYIERAEDLTFSDGLTYLIAPSGSGLRTFTDPGAPDGITYYYRVRAENAVQVSAFSMPARVSPGVTNHAPVLTGSMPTSMNVSPLSDYPSVLHIEGTIRDFHPHSTASPNDFENHTWSPSYSANPVTGLVSDTLGVDGTPVLSTSPWSSGHGWIHDATSFHSWYHDVPGQNLSQKLSLPFKLKSYDTGTPIYEFGSDTAEFLPINGRLFGNENLGNTVNGNFTLEIHTTFTYHANNANPPRFEFVGDDDLWVYINNELALDMGGIHPQYGLNPNHNNEIVLDDATAAALGLVDGGTYTFDMFFAERQMGGSYFRAQTSIPIFGDYKYVAQLTATDSDPGDELRYAVLEPEGAILSNRTGPSALVTDVTYVPSESDLGTTKHFAVAVDDGHGGSDIIEWDVSFASSNNEPPIAVNPTPPLTATVGQLYTWNAATFFSDPDGHSLTFLASAGTPLPDGMTLSSAGVFAWIPTANQVENNIVSFTVSDGHNGHLQYQFVVDVTGGPTLVTVTAGTTADFVGAPLYTDVDLEASVGEQVRIYGYIILEGQNGTEQFELQSLKVLPPSDPDSPYVFGQDHTFTEVANRDLLFTSHRPGVYTIKFEYKSASDEVQYVYGGVFVDTGVGDDTKKKGTTKTKTKTRTRDDDLDYDLVLIGGAPADLYLSLARITWPQHLDMWSVDDAIEKIQYFAALHYAMYGDSDHFDVLVVDHGNVGRMWMGSGLPNPAGTYIEWDDPVSQGDLENYIDGIALVSPVVDSVTFYSCNTAAEDKGKDFLKYIAQESGVKHSAYDGYVYTTFWGTTYVDEGTLRWIATPDGNLRSEVP